MTVAELSARMSAAEFNEWMCYARIEPFGEEHRRAHRELTTDAIIGHLSTIFARVMGVKKRLKPSDFMVFNRRQAQAADLLARGRSMFGHLIRDKKDGDA